VCNEILRQLLEMLPDKSGGQKHALRVTSVITSVRSSTPDGSVAVKAGEGKAVPSVK